MAKVLQVKTFFGDHLCCVGLRNTVSVQIVTGKDFFLEPILFSSAKKRFVGLE